MQRHWTEVAPPAHVALARLAGLQPRGGSASAGAVQDPDDLARQLRAMGLMG